ncbi:MAG TPA: biotin/lipoyl-containing protein, partial [Corynebacterium sp.]|nr:biotin/lipoyl-containing protein [Corynebacterium sp.]
MAFSVEMPELGESVTEGTITQWLKQVGDRVEVDEPLLEVSTDKVDTEIPSPKAGVLLEIRAEEDDTVDVGEVIAIIGEEGEESSADSAEAEAEAEEAPAEEPEEEKKAAPKASGKATDVEMPELGESVTEGTITQWLKSVGDTVEVDEPLLEVSTDKVDTEIPSPVAGTIIEILADEDDTVDVGEVIARIGDADAAEADDEDVPSEEAESKDENETVDEAAPAEEDAAEGESTDVEMPELGESVTEGTITQWLKSVGDSVEVDEPLLEVSTDKVDTEIP